MSHTFTGHLFRWSGESAAWYFVQFPPEIAPAEAGWFGRRQVTAVVDGHAWETSTWRGKDGRVLLAVPKGRPPRDPFLE